MLDLSMDHGLKEAHLCAETGFDITAQTQQQPHLLTCALSISREELQILEKSFFLSSISILNYRGHMGNIDFVAQGSIDC